MISFGRALVALCLCAGASAAAAPPAVSDAWIRATPPGARTAAADQTITSLDSADRLVGAETPAARAVEIHTHVVDGGLQRMVRIGELPLPAGEKVQLAPGGLHLMLLDIAAPLVAGMKVSVSLRFATAEPVELELPVVDARGNARAPQTAH